MPPAIIGAIGGSLISGLFGQQQQNSQQQAQQNAQNQGEQFASQQQQQAIAAMQAARAQAMQQFQQFQQSNPNPVNAWANSPIVGPTPTAPSQIGGGLMGANGTPSFMAPTPQFSGNPEDGANLMAFLRMLQPPTGPTAPSGTTPTPPTGPTTKPVLRIPIDPGNGYPGTHTPIGRIPIQVRL